jgi:hypothetical protein
MGGLRLCCGVSLSSPLSREERLLLPACLCRLGPHDGRVGDGAGLFRNLKAQMTWSPPPAGPAATTFSCVWFESGMSGRNRPRLQSCLDQKLRVDFTPDRNILWMWVSPTLKIWQTEQTRAGSFAWSVRCSFCQFYLSPLRHRARCPLPASPTEYDLDLIAAGPGARPRLARA